MLIRSWFELNTSCSHKQKKSSMISTKVTPTVKATSVNVSSDERNNNLTMTFEPLRSASLSLSIELAKDMPSISIRQHKPDTLSVYTNHCFKRIAKAAPATFSTSVSANGTMGHQDDGSAAMESLAKSIIQLDNESSTHQESQQVTKNETRTLVSPTCQSTSFWTWLGLPSAEEPQEEKELVEDMAASAPIPIKSTSHTVTNTASSSWSSFLFAANVDKVQVCTNPEEPSTPKPLYIQKALQEEQNNIRKVKSLSSCPIPNTKLAPSHTSTLRPSVSSSSLQSQKPGKITNNKVLPLFASQCQVQSLPEKDTFFTKAFDTIQSIMQPPETTTSWIAKKMKAKFSHFVQDLKQPQPILMDKRIVVVGVHGWFPMKVCFLIHTTQ
ncbi:uncharacterized protein B0P05DRAFT_125982 [Gilbertella persicaria]|uniref:uncharacterized protein n=1 Tax=Gilbertella persicaria TaxID=101096 RepID=UPI0022202158|nr:uncharacterized protein B0P05DRAFT_125982 [Gilbertella persicaria]KAI8077287.1 hypothetical protein B0P05DRAFT_125982 [Gilbertella persicaria]